MRTAGGLCNFTDYPLYRFGLGNVFYYVNGRVNFACGTDRDGNPVAVLGIWAGTPTVGNVTAYQFPLAVSCLPLHWMYSGPPAANLGVCGIGSNADAIIEIHE
jgi:hypothetical protein